jgi:hypothetical protein
MLARLVNLSLLAALLLAGSGCRCCRGWHGNDYCDCSCGECYWSEWFNDPPDCQDPCDCYGNYAGHRHRTLMLAGHHEPVPTLASPEIEETIEGMPTPADALPQPEARPNVPYAEPQPAPAEIKPSPPSEIESTIDTMPTEPTPDDLVPGDLPIFNNE